MRFNPKARLDPSQVQVRRGGGGRRGGRGGGFGGGFGGGGIPIPMGRMGGGLGGLVVLVVILFLSGALGGGGGGAGGGFGAGTVTPRSATEPVRSSELSECRTGADANRNPDCARLAVVNSIQDYWSRTLPEQAGEEYAEADTVMFSQAVETGCGSATADVGPFYCPARGDMQVYLDTTFFDDVLEGQLGAAGGDFAEAYVLAHEYGHHVENLLGYMGRVRTQQGPESDAVKLELMADCLAGMWARHATNSEDASGNVLILELTDEDIREALDAAAAVGDDAIQGRSGRVDPESWTHGSAPAREMWFQTGYRAGSLQGCDTWEADRLYP